MNATLTILYDGDDAGGRQFSNSDDGLRNPDNLDWGDDGFIYVQEDNAKALAPLFGSHSGMEASIWRLHPETRTIQRIAQMDRSVILPLGSTDNLPTRVGMWESSGILDVTSLFDAQIGERFLLATVQAHTVRNGPIQKDQLVEAGQILLLRKKLSASKSKGP